MLQAVNQQNKGAVLMKESDTFPKDAKRQFRTLGSCSQTYAFLLNRQFSHPNKIAERATDPLAGGINRQGYQCGMLWGAVLAAGAESYRRYGTSDKGVAIAMKASQDILKSFIATTNSADCFDITDCDWTSKLSAAKFMVTGKFLSCFKLVEKWAPEAYRVADESLASEPPVCVAPAVSCASEIVRKLKASDEEAAMVAGFAGGLGLSGNACGALAAAIWWDSYSYYKNLTGKSRYPMSRATVIIDKFYKANDYEILCSKLTGKTFSSIDEHSLFICGSGCANLIKGLV
jgi:hypothetical protein